MVFQLLKEARQHCYAQDYAGALEKAKQIREGSPNDPAGVFAYLGIYQTITETYRIRRYISVLDSLIQLSIDMSQSRLERASNHGKNYLYLASGYGSGSLVAAWQGNWTAAFKNGLNVKENYEKALELTPDFYDAYYGLGMYHYWKVAKAKILKLFGDSRKKGIEQVEVAIEKSRFSQTDASFSLSAMYFNEKEYQKALEICDRMYAEFPTHPGINYRQGRIYQEFGQWQAAKQKFEYLYGLLTNTEYQALSFQIDCLYQLAMSEYKLENYAEARRHCKRALALEKRCDFSKELDGAEEQYSSIKKKLKKLNQDLAKT